MVNDVGVSLERSKPCRWGSWLFFWSATSQPHSLGSDTGAVASPCPLLSPPLKYLMLGIAYVAEKDLPRVWKKVLHLQRSCLRCPAGKAKADGCLQQG